MMPTPLPGNDQADCKREPGRKTNVDNYDRTESKRQLEGSTSVGNNNSFSPHSHRYKRRRSETGHDDVGQTKQPAKVSSAKTEGSVLDTIKPQDGEDSDKLAPPRDEAEEIQRRRALRAQILAKHQQATSGQVTVLPSSQSATAQSPSAGEITDSPIATQPASPQSTIEIGFDLKSNTARTQKGLEDDLSAADYDPDADRVREHEKRRAHLLETALPVQRDIQSEEEGEEEDDMFADPVHNNGRNSAYSNRDNAGVTNVTHAVGAQKLDETMLDSWADTEGYYRIMIGELLDSRYAVQSILGKGVFSAVVKAIDQDSGESVAIKVIRNNDVMRKAGLQEIRLLEQLMAADPTDRKHVIRLRGTFDHRNHLCLVFEMLSLNLREVLKKFGRDVGINLKAVRAYGQQIFLALSLMRKCNIMHADLKPDNILVSESRTLLKICDLGSASDTSENALTPYLASRFYRAPEVILGLQYDASMDMWAIGCTLYEMYTGKILFPGRTNNQMLRLFMECKGRFPQKLLRKAAFAGTHFDDQYNFNSTEVDKATGEEVVRVLNIARPVKDLRSRLLPGADPSEKSLVLQFIDLLERCTDLDGGKRLTPSEALKHPFIARTK